MVGTVQAAAEIADDAGRNGQPEAEPVTGRLGREEGLEQVGLRLGAEPGAMVADMQADAAVGAFPGEVDARLGLAGLRSELELGADTLSAALMRLPASSLYSARCKERRSRLLSVPLE